MPRIRSSCLGLSVSLFVWSSALAQFSDFHGKVDPRWTGPTFKLSQNYPNSVVPENFPWKAYSFQQQPREYLYAVLAYVLDGNLEVDWRVQENSKRKWYHVPWMEWDTYGREYVRGLTRERNGNLAELTGTGDPATSKRAQSWAIGFYNAIGGYTVGQVWKDPNNPDPRLSQFPEGTVVAKLLFTEFTEADLPFLRNSLIWQAAIHGDPKCRRQPPLRNGSEPTDCERALPQDVRLIQLDVAVKDHDAGVTNWIFGTFVFNGNLANDQSTLLPSGPPWNRMVPVGLMWGNDPSLQPNSGANPQETRILPTGLYQHLGCAARLNGPIDNPLSSCMSCHMQAQFPPSPKPLTPPKCDAAPSNMSYFVNLAPTQLFDSSVLDAAALDFSLQMQGALRNFRAAHPTLTTSKLMIVQPDALRSLFDDAHNR